MGNCLISSTLHRGFLCWQARMTAADLQKKNYSGEVVEGLPDEPVIADILKGQKFSVTDVRAGTQRNCQHRRRRFPLRAP